MCQKFHLKYSQTNNSKEIMVLENTAQQFLELNSSVGP